MHDTPTIYTGSHFTLHITTNGGLNDLSSYKKWAKAVKEDLADEWAKGVATTFDCRQDCC